MALVYEKREILQLPAFQFAPEGAQCGPKETKGGLPAVITLAALLIAAPALAAGSPAKASATAPAAANAPEAVRTIEIKVTEAGFELLPGVTPIIPVMTHDAVLAQKLAAELDARGVYVAGAGRCAVSQWSCPDRSRVAVGNVAIRVPVSPALATRPRAQSAAR